MKIRKPSRKIIAISIIVIIIAGFAVIKMRQSANKPPIFQTSRVERGTVLSSVSGTGVLQPLTTVEVKSNVGGQIVELTVDEGDVVQAGQVIARIDPSDSISSLDQAKADFSSANAKVAQSRQALSMQQLQTTANIRSAQQALEASKERLSQAEEQAIVQPKLTAELITQSQSALDSAQSNLSQIKSSLNPQKLASAKAAYDQAKSSYEQTQKSFNRQQALLERGFISQSVADDTKAQFESAQAQLDTAKSKYDTVKEELNQDTKNAESKVAQAKSALQTAHINKIQDSLKKKDLSAARASYNQAVATLASAQASKYQDQMKSEEILQAQAQFKKSEAAMQNAQTTLGYTTVIAPRSGVVVKKYVEKGSIVTAGRQAMAGSGSGVTIVDIADVSRMRVVVDVDETDVGKISLGQKVDVNVDACPDEVFPAKVIKIAPMAIVNQNVTTVPVTVEIVKADKRFKPEMNADCNFVVERKDNVLYVPVEAITETDSGKEVTVFDRDQPVVRKVQVGITGDDYCEITSGLSDGEVVIIPEDDSAQKNSNMGPGRGGPGGGGPGGPPPPM